MTECNPWPPYSRPKPFVVAIPGSILSVESNLLMKTLKAGIISRALSVFRIDKVYIYIDPDTSGTDKKILYSILRYLEVPPHLRKKIIPLKKELRWVGILPPLRTPLHVVPEKLRSGDVIEGIVEDDCKVYLGEKLGVWRLDEKNCNNLKRNSRVVVYVVDEKKKIVKMFKGNIYRGYKVRSRRSLIGLVKELKKEGYYLIATSRKGKCYTLEELSKRIKKGFLTSKGLAVLFGGPRRGLLDLLDKPDLFDEVVNTVPFQGTKTVRTEEALWITLSLINYILLY